MGSKATLIMYELQYPGQVFKPDLRQWSIFECTIYGGAQGCANVVSICMAPKVNTCITDFSLFHSSSGFDF